MFSFALIFVTIHLAFASNVKRGLAYADSLPDIVRANQSDTAISWLYNWGTTPPSYLQTSGISYIPMQWGADGIEGFAATVKEQGATAILGFNEPDFASQSNISPTEAAQLWRQYIEPLAASGIRLGAPAVTSADTGRPWLQDFIAACTGCTIDFVPLHWYGTGIGNFYDYIWSFHGEFPNYPLWVTEFADTSTAESDVTDFLGQTIAYMDTLDWIERYSWFGYFRADGTSQYSLLDAAGNLNALGDIYVNEG